MHGLREAPVQSWRGETATSVAKLYICEVTRDATGLQSIGIVVGGPAGATASANARCGER